MESFTVRETARHWAAVLGLVWLSGCSSTSSSEPVEKVRGKVGESCQVHDDCESSLSCVRQVCVSGVYPQPGNQDGGAHPVGAPLGALGESCGSRADCEPDLACFDNVCSAHASGGGDAGSAPRVGQRGESCRTRTDCESNLACIAGVCTLADFGLTPTTKKCELVQCQTVTDCCPKPSSSCPFYDQYCKQGDQAYCDQYQRECVCDEAQWACTENKCQFTPKCDPTTLTCPTTCSPTTPGCPKQLVCAGTRCVECTADADCGTTGKCSNEKCLVKCDTDADCPYLNKCQGGACIESGCTTNRECIADTGNVLSLCQAGKCLVPCETDLECDSPLHFTFKACVNGYCNDVGCETDEECRIQLKVTPGSTTSAVCR